MATATYDDMLVSLALLIEEDVLEQGLNNEYLRGAVSLIADVFGKLEVDTSTRMDQVLDDLASNYHYIWNNERVRNVKYGC